MHFEGSLTKKVGSNCKSEARMLRECFFCSKTISFLNLTLLQTWDAFSLFLIGRFLFVWNCVALFPSLCSRTRRVFTKITKRPLKGKNVATPWADQNKEDTEQVYAVAVTERRPNSGSLLVVTSPASRHRLQSGPPGG